MECSKIVHSSVGLFPQGFSRFSVLAVMVTALAFFITQPTSLKAKSIVSETDIRAANVETASWQAMSEFYAQNAMLANELSLAEAARAQVTRWLAIAEFYQERDMSSNAIAYEQAADSLTDRWQIMVDSYEHNEALIKERHALEAIVRNR